ncbi:MULTISPECIES: cobalamin B12-binding domain-containing protein [Methylomonas]|uniref:Cobalamin-binding protein n=2 Tax=Methylomonas TaxID=416 RepID=A0A126T5R6_9GAMM|nr:MULTISPECIES: cobalamin-dependent protein [Methylomonas]AMK77417.1 cobalamin-binding protein [Methylomonas denitrificans]OAI05009.1 cobalamin-binding protein [Methylomonas methanica]TCV84543.1 methanogenic corrinoid protein MtbC1 [Methylomonas methanica]
MLDAYIQSYNQAVFETDKPAALEVVNQALSDGLSPEDIVFKLVIPAVELMMALIEKDPDANLAQHFMTAQIAADVTEKMLEKFSKPPEMIGRVVIGAAYGDLHSLGKRIVSGCLKSLMVDVVDLGTNVSAEKFVDTAVTENAQVIAVSAMMVHTATSEKGSLGVRTLLQQRGLQQQIKLAVGGAPYRFDPELYVKVGADAWAPDGVTAAKVIVDLIREVKP